MSEGTITIQKAEGDQRLRGGQRRAQILDAALRLFAQNGMAQVTTRQIAQAVGISQPSLYAHFRSADEIAAELCARAFAALANDMQQVAAAGANPLERIHLMGRAYIEFGLNHPDMYRVAFMLEDAKPCAVAPGPDGLPVDPVMAAGLGCFAVIHQAMIDHLGAEGSTALLAAQSAWAHVHGLTSLLIARSDFPWADREALIAAHLERMAL